MIFVIAQYENHAAAITVQFFACIFHRKTQGSADLIVNNGLNIGKIYVSINGADIDDMKQQTFTDIEYSNRKKKTKREQFLEMMDKIIPWKEWCDLI